MIAGAELSNRFRMSACNTLTLSKQGCAYDVVLTLSKLVNAYEVTLACQSRVVLTM